MGRSLIRFSFLAAAALLVGLLASTYVLASSDQVEKDKRHARALGIPESIIKKYTDVEKTNDDKMMIDSISVAVAKELSKVAFTDAMVESVMERVGNDAIVDSIANRTANAVVAALDSFFSSVMKSMGFSVKGSVFESADTSGTKSSGTHVNFEVLFLYALYCLCGCMIMVHVHYLIEDYVIIKMKKKGYSSVVWIVRGGIGDDDKVLRTFKSNYYAKEFKTRIESEMSFGGIPLCLRTNVRVIMHDMKDVGIDGVILRMSTVPCGSGGNNRSSRIYKDDDAAHKVPSGDSDSSAARAADAAMPTEEDGFCLWTHDAEFMTVENDGGIRGDSN